MEIKDGYLAKVAEMRRQAALCVPGVEHDALLEGAAHWERLAHLAAWQRRKPN